MAIIKNKFRDYEKARKNPFAKTYYEPSLDDLLRAASYVVDTLPPELLASETGKEARLADRLIENVQPDKFLQTYAEIYSIYKQYFDTLPPDMQSQIRSEFESKLQNKYPNLELQGFGIPHPNDVQRRVNSVISKEMVDNRERYGREKGNSTTVAILKATKYMSSEQVASVYSQIKAECDRSYAAYGIERNDFMENLQHNFARAILAKNVDSQLSPREEREMLIDICDNYFQEEASESLIDVELIEKRKQIRVTEEPKRLSVFGLSKLDAVFSRAKKVYGQYANYDALEIMVTEHAPEVQETGKTNTLK